jgi:hypothetical protein
MVKMVRMAGSFLDCQSLRMEFAAVTAERLRTELVDRRSQLLLESRSRGAVGAFSLQPDSPTLEAAHGTWVARDVQALDRHRKAHYSLADAGGVEVATAWPEGSRVRLELASERLSLESPSLLQWRYRIEGLFVARPSLLMSATSRASVARNARRPFRIDVTPALAARGDASLILLLATWLAWWDAVTRTGAT